MLRGKVAVLHGEVTLLHDEVTSSILMPLLVHSTIFRPNTKCHVTLMGTDVYIQTWTESQGGTTLVGSAYPDWSL